MDSKKLAKIIKLIVELELKRQLPAITSLIKEEVARELLKTNKISTKKMVEEIDPFALASSMLDKSRSNEPIQDSKDAYQVENKKRLSKNPILNDILNKTKPFKEAPSLNENINQYEEWPGMEFNQNIAAAGVDGMSAQMSAKLGNGSNNNVPPLNVPKGGLGVTTGLPYLDRVLNRDNSELVRKFKTRK